ncbi:Cysteine_and tyrosine-rich protein 1 [Hexamita inflata]|uniref:Cysteine and tyrosine-rich protein 1 n=1 Tax=Hexamita inflata TaxID=28002 RepID=A0AA86UYZ3_9EUKA|nr:Cysteine and tyrosine-rich protein 1 [Hexamita inflata]CAI9973719.1 Cysteine and tyrosine-rich protein 1 [Hexamita inflata]
MTCYANEQLCIAFCKKYSVYSCDEVYSTCYECTDLSVIGDVLSAWLIAVIVIGVLIFLGIIGCIIGCVCSCFRAASPGKTTTYVIQGQNQIPMQQVYQPQQQMYQPQQQQQMPPQQVQQNYPQPPVLPAQFQ